jgi:phosphoglucosamine mutase
VNGIANVYPMTSEVALKIGRAVPHVFKDRYGRGRIVVEGVDRTAVKGYADEIGDAARKRLSEARHA